MHGSSAAVISEWPTRPVAGERWAVPHLVSEQGVVYCLELKTGTLVYGPSRIPNDFYSSSPVLADGNIYVTGESTGVTTVFRAGPKFEILASNTFNDPCAPYCLASIAVSQGSCSSKRTRTCGWSASAKVTPSGYDT